MSVIASRIGQLLQCTAKAPFELGEPVEGIPCPLELALGIVAELGDFSFPVELLHQVEIFIFEPLGGGVRIGGLFQPVEGVVFECDRISLVVGGGERTIQ